MSFAVSAAAYGRFMGRYSEPLAGKFVALCSMEAGSMEAGSMEAGSMEAGGAGRRTALDVGCGPGALTARLIERLGPGAVSAVDPSESFVAAAQARFPGVEVRQGVAEDLPFPSGAFDFSLAQLVVHFMKDPVDGLTEMARVTRPGGLVAASVWDHAGGRGPLSTFWRAVLELDPDATDESGLTGARDGELAELFYSAGLHDVQSTAISVRVGFGTFAAWWDPFTLGVGPAGSYVAALDAAGRDALRAQCARLFPSGPFEIVATAWAALGRAN